MRKSILEAPPALLDQYRAYRDGCTVLEPDAAAAIEFCLRVGFLPEPPKTPAHDLVREATHRGDFAQLLALRNANGWRLLQETRAIERFNGIPERWKQEPNDGEVIAARKAARDEAERQAAITRRAEELMADEMKAARARAVAAATAELSPAPATRAPVKAKR